MKLYLDDIRTPPDDSWQVVRTAEEAIEILKTGKVNAMSFDHDLGEGKKTGYDVLVWIEREVFKKKMNPPKMKTHTQNPVGKEKMEAAMIKIWDIAIGRE